MNLRGLDAINAAHGFSVTMVGILTVFLGLFGLFVVLSEMHKLILLWDNRSQFYSKLNSKLNFLKKKEPFPGYRLLKNCPSLVREEARQLYTLAKFIGNEFTLSQLLELAIKRRVAISSSTIKILKDKGIIISKGKGRFYWVE